MTGFNAVMYVSDYDDSQTLNETAVDKFTLKPFAVGAAGPFPNFG